MSASLREFRHELTPEQAVALFAAVAHSPHTNGLADLYVALGDFVRDDADRVPGCVNYDGPAWGTT